MCVRACVCARGCVNSGGWVVGLKRVGVKVSSEAVVCVRERERVRGSERERENLRQSIGVSEGDRQPQTWRER